MGSYVGGSHDKEIEICHLGELEEQILWKEAHDVVLRRVDFVRNEGLPLVAALAVDLEGLEAPRLLLAHVLDLGKRPLRACG